MLQGLITQKKMRPLSVYSKYAFYVAKYGTPKKISNILLNQYEFRNGKSILKSRPYKVTVDPGNFCNLRCPGCHTGIKHPQMIKPSFLKYSNYKIILDQVKDYALSIALYNWGEPFLNKEIFDIIAHTRANGLGTTIHSNFNVFNEDMAESAVRSGLTHIYLSIDGASQEAYQKYRVRGHLANVLDNVKLLVDTKKRMRSKYPIVTWKFLVFEHNKHEIADAAKMAKSIGVDSFEVFVAHPKLMDLYDEAENYRNNPELIQSLNDRCKSLWSSIYIHSDGSMFPCSLSYRENERFGNLLEHDLNTVWNNRSYINARKMFSPAASVDEIPLPCRSCKYSMKTGCALTAAPFSAEMQRPQ